MGRYDGHDVATVLAYVITLVISYGSQAGLFGKTNADISKQYETPLTPAGFTFAIWGIIFIGQGIAVAYLMYRPDDASFKQSVVKSVCIWWIFGWAAESVWQYLFQLQTKPALIACAVALLAAVYAFANAYRNALAVAPPLTDVSPAALAQHVLVGSTAINTAWLTVAGSVGVLIALVVNTSLHMLPLAIAAAVAIAVVGAGVVVQAKAWAYGATLVWAFYGVSVKQQAYPAVQNVSYVAMAVLGLLSAVALMQLARSSRSSGPGSPLLG